jgi:hypothetical protein
VSILQGDQMGRILAHWAIVYYGHFKKFAEVGHILDSTVYIMQ